MSSDADFNKLAKGLRESGNLVIGIGEQKTPKAFRTSCKKKSLDIIDEDIELEDVKLDTVTNNNRISEKSVIINRYKVEDIWGGRHGKNSEVPGCNFKR